MILTATTVKFLKFIKAFLLTLVKYKKDKLNPKVKWTFVDLVYR